MNRQPFNLNPGSSAHCYYDEDLDRREDMGHGITMVRLCRHHTRKVTKWDINFVDLANKSYVGGVTNVRGLNVYVHGNPARQSAEVKGLKTEAEAIHAAKLLIGVLFS